MQQYKAEAGDPGERAVRWWPRMATSALTALRTQGSSWRQSGPMEGNSGKGAVYFNVVFILLREWMYMKASCNNQNWLGLKQKVEFEKNKECLTAIGRKRENKEPH